MQAIKITTESTAAIDAVLSAVNSHATAHRYTTAAEIVAIADAAEKRLEALGVAKKYRAGAVVAATSGDSVPNSYKFARTATAVRLERRSAAWYLTAAKEMPIYKNGGGPDLLLLTQEQDAIAVAALRKGYCIQLPKNES